MPNNIGPAFEDIPVLDMQQFISEQKNDRDQFIGRLLDVCHNVGFFYIKNHCISSTLMEHMLTLTKAFFNLPQNEKDALCISQSPHYRGYGKLGAEITQGIPDYKETFDLGLEQATRELTPEQPYLVLQGPNQWPISRSLSDLRWKETLLEYMAAMLKIGKQLMSAISLSLGFPADYFVSKFCSNSQDAYAILRLLRYPPGRATGSKEKPELGVGPHTDVGCLVMLLQDDVGGLQVQNCSGKWVDAPPIKDTLVVNIGEMLQIWSNNHFLATPHRVINVSGKIRHSIPFFFEPNLTTVVSPLEIAGATTRPKIKPDTSVIYGEHMLKVFKRSF